MDAQPVPTVKRRRWLPRLRFSLRTLLLAVLAAASGATLWWNWGPWKLVYIVNEPGEIAGVVFDVNDQYAIFRYHYRHKSSEGCEDIRIAQTGQQQAIMCDGADSHYSGMNENYIILTHRPDAENRLIKFPELYDIRTGQSIGTPPICIQQPGKWNWECMPRFLLLRDEKTTRILHLPDFKLFQEFKEYVTALDQDTLMIRDKGLYTLQNVDTGKITITIEDEGYYRFHAGNTLIFESDMSWFAIDAISGKLLHSVRAPFRGFSPDGKFLFTRTIDNTVEIHNVETRTITARIPVKPLNSWQTPWSMNSSPDNTLLFSRWDRKMYDAKTLKILWDRESERTGRLSNLSAMGDAVCLYDYDPTLVDARSGSTLMDFTSLRWRYYHLGDTIEFADHSNDFIIYHWMHNDHKERAGYFHQIRPIAWYGPAYLAEFWLTILFTTALIWSLLRDRRTA